MRRSADHGLDVVARGVYADDSVARPVEQAVQDGGRDAAGIVRRVVWLDSDREAPLEADGVAEGGARLDLARGEDEVLGPHDLGHGRGHLRHEAGRDARYVLARRGVGKEPLAEVSDREGRDLSEGGVVQAVDYDSRDFVLLVGQHEFLEEALERDVREGHLRRRALLGGGCGHAGEDIARAPWRGLGEERLEVGKAIGGRADRRGVFHAFAESSMPVSIASRSDSEPWARGPLNHLRAPKTQARATISVAPSTTTGV